LKAVRKGVFDGDGEGSQIYYFGKQVVYKYRSQRERKMVVLISQPNEALERQRRS